MTGLDTAAQLAVLGLDPIAWLYENNSFSRELVLQLAIKIQHYRDIEQHNLAVKIAQEVSKLFKK